MTIREKLIEKNIPIDSHCSDLYCKITEESLKIIDNYEFKSSVTWFRSRVDNTFWFDIPFANDEYWNNKLKQ